MKLDFVWIIWAAENLQDMTKTFDGKEIIGDTWLDVLDLF